MLYILHIEKYNLEKKKMKGEAMKFHLLIFMVFLVTLASAASSPSVIIVGAGMSGISAAKDLHDQGVKDFIFLEATDRIGGRIHKTEFAGHAVEMGANWLHGVGGPRKNPMYEIAKEIKLRSFYSDWNNISYNSYKQEGGRYSKEEVDAALDMAESNEDYAEELSERLSAKKGKDDDMSLLAAERLNHREPKTPLEKMIDFYSFDGEQAESPRVTSLKHIIPRPEYTLFGENDYFVADSRGFESIVHHIAKTYLTYTNDTLNDPRVIFNQVVKEVDYSNSGIVTVKTEDGNEYTAQAVILSPSVGVLQSGLISFKPELPFWKRRAIAEFSLGIYTKIFLKFPKKFWPTGKGTEFFFYAHERRGYYAFWQQLEMEYPGSNILMVTVTDDESKRVEAQPDEKTKAEAMEVLRKIFGDDIPDATEILIPRWYSDRFYKGTFSNWPVGYTIKKHNNLKAPVENVFFTGEHTHAQLFGYADGAYYAGKRAANDVNKLLKKKKSPNLRSLYYWWM
ncbi:polyamine oxidase-like [Chenopodium quinoa]|uniref:polyamine oxidase-like n=1 Tax=Chenopodium quinoa TaxID=63459 RepID=UPI000B77094C|nr:polyamine oxidase-like [Chenopodium quinoa]